jgi:TatA/E family protein of Tat protein translocase
MFGLGGQELLIVLGVGFLLFGGRKLPEIGEGLGKGITSFKRALQDRPGTSAAGESRLLAEEKPESR